MKVGDVAAMLLARWKRLAVALLLLWGLVTFLVISPLRCGGAGEGGGEDRGEAAGLKQRLALVSEQLEALRSQHAQLRAQVKASKLSGVEGLEGVDVDEGPSEEYETLRRRVYSSTKELWYLAQHELGQALKEDQRAERLQALLHEVDDRQSALLADQQRLWAADGHAEWRAREAALVSGLVQRRLAALQRPADCTAARKLLCNLNKGCGFGCQLHHIAYCLIFAYATERTLVLNSRGWRYNARGWDLVFHRLSPCAAGGEDAVQWPVAYDAKVVYLPFVDSIAHKPKFLPLAVPKDLAHRIVRFNGDPASWWVGQMLQFILRPRAALARTINDTIARIHYRTPIVGVHVRRTDKVGTEAAFHGIHEYMAHVEQYWRTRDLADGQPVPRRVYLASDDPAVLGDARKKYPHVEFIGDAEIARTAATHRRYTPASLAGLLVDLTLLARADFLVCTFSSQVGRVAYELMQANRADAADSVFSLDDIYYFGGQNAHDRVAVLPHEPRRPQEIALQAGDRIGVAGNHWNGYGRGTNYRTNQNGLWPWYKTADHLVLFPFPEYKSVPLRPPKDGPADSAALSGPADPVEPADSADPAL